MKTKKMNGKLLLNKSTIADLARTAMNGVKGGTEQTNTYHCFSLEYRPCLESQRQSCEPDFCDSVIVPCHTDFVPKSQLSE